MGDCSWQVSTANSLDPNYSFVLKEMFFRWSWRGGASPSTARRCTPNHKRTESAFPWVWSTSPATLGHWQLEQAARRLPLRFAFSGRCSDDWRRRTDKSASRSVQADLWRFGRLKEKLHRTLKIFSDELRIIRNKFRSYLLILFAPLLHELWELLIALQLMSMVPLHHPSWKQGNR